MKLYALTALILASSLLSANAATTTIYKSVGPKGETRYSQIRPANVKKFETIEMRSDGRTATTGQMAQLPTETTAATPQSAEQQRIAELEKQMQEQQNNEKLRTCQNMRTNLANLSTGGRMYETNDKGERVYLNDQEISSKRQRITDAIAQHCN